MHKTKIALASAMIGNIVEWYDFSLYASATPLVFSRVFFSQKHDPFFIQVEAIALFGTGFLVRPGGGMLFGYIGDRYGHLVSLRWTLFLIGIATALIGILPTYAQIGVSAPLLLLLLRLIQGGAAGGEWAGSVLVLGGTTQTNSKSRHLMLALSQSGVALGMVLGTGAMWLLRQLPEEEFLSWGWRIAFLATLPFVVLGIFLRSSLTVAPVRTHASPVFSFRALFCEPVAILRGIGVRLSENGGIYLISVFGLAYGRSCHVSDSILLAAVTCGLAADGLMMPIFGWLSIRMGHSRIYLFGIVALAVLIVPFFSFVATGQPISVILAFALIMMLAHAPMIAVEPHLLEKLFPAHCRYSGIAVSHEFGSIIAGGVSPLLAAFLYHETGSVNGVIVYVFLLAICSAAALYWPATRSKDHSSLS